MLLPWALSNCGAAPASANELSRCVRAILEHCRKCVTLGLCAAGNLIAFERVPFTLLPSMLPLGDLVHCHPCSAIHSS